MIVRRIKFLSQSSLPADGGTTVVGGDFFGGPGYRLPTRDTGGVGRTVRVRAACGRIRGRVAVRNPARIVDWLWAGLSLAIIFALLILWWA